MNGVPKLGTILNNLDEVGMISRDSERTILDNSGRPCKQEPISPRTFFRRNRILCRNAQTAEILALSSAGAITSNKQ